MRNTFIKTKLGNILSAKRGTSLSGEYYATCGDKIRLTLGNFNYPNGGFKINTAKDNLYFNGEVKSEYILKKDAIITPLTEQVAGLLGETARIPESNKYIQCGDIALIIPNTQKLDDLFAYYLISSNAVKKQLGAVAQQTKIRHTSPQKIEDCIVWLPEDINVQHKIGYFIDLINRKIELNNKINSELETLAKTLYDYWFVQFDFPDEFGRPYKSSGGKMVYDEKLKRNVPINWEVKRIDEILLENNKSSLQVKQVNNFGLYPFFTSGNDILKHDEYLVDGLNCYLSTGGNASVKYYDGKASYSTDTWCIFAQKYTYYLYSYLNSILSQMDTLYFAGTGLKHLQKDIFKNTYLLIPPKDYIEKYNQIILNGCKKCSICYLENQQLTQLRDWLLPMLMNGQIIVNS